MHGNVSLPNGGFVKNAVMLGGGISSSDYIDNKNIFLGKGPTQDDFIDCENWILY